MNGNVSTMYRLQIIHVVHSFVAGFKDQSAACVEVQAVQAPFAGRLFNSSGSSNSPERVLLPSGYD